MAMPDARTGLQGPQDSFVYLRNLRETGMITPQVSAMHSPPVLVSECRTFTRARLKLRERLGVLAD